MLHLEVGNKHKMLGYQWLILISTIITVILQIPAFENLRIINYFMWPVTGILVMVSQKGIIGKTTIGLFYVFLEIWLFLLCALCTMITGKSYLECGALKILILPLFMYWIGIQINDSVFLKKIFKGYIVAAIVLATYICVVYIPSFSTWSVNEVYLYGSKNSAAQIFSSAALLALYNETKKKSENVLKLLATGYLILVTALLQCRTAMLGTLAAVIFIEIVVKKKRLRTMFGVILGTTVLLRNEKVQSFVQQAFLIRQYTGRSLNDFSSGRLMLYKVAIDKFSLSPWIGIGDYYVDDFFINALVEIGILGGGVVVGFWIFVTLRNLRLTIKNNDEIQKILGAMTVYYFVTSLMEAFPPFGPGSCSFVFWLLQGYCDGMNQKNILDRRAV
mgnify:FL=1